MTPLDPGSLEPLHDPPAKPITGEKRAIFTIGEENPIFTISDERVPWPLFVARTNSYATSKPVINALYLLASSIMNKKLIK